MKKLYRHQEAFLEKNPNKALLAWATGTGKTLAACEWLNLRKNKKALVVCPKPIIGKWKRDLKEAGTIAKVISHDGIKKEDISIYKALVIDEAQGFSSPLFTKQRSQRSTKLYEHIRQHPDTHILLTTATPIRSTFWNIHTLATYIGQFWPVRPFREKFERLVDLYGRWHYEPIPDWRKKIRPYVEMVADIIRIEDVAELPEQQEGVIHIKWTKKQEEILQKNLTEKGIVEPSAQWHARHRVEQGEEKLHTIRQLTDGYQKCILVCIYLEQIKYYTEKLGKDRAVFVLQGSTKNPDAVIQEAREAQDGIFIVQASMGQGWDASEFSVIIFASLSFRYIDLVQMRGRVIRINNLHKNLFIYLLGGKCDNAVYKRIMQGKDFDVHQAVLK